MSDKKDNDRVVPHNIYAARDAGGYVGPGADDDVRDQKTVNPADEEWTGMLDKDGEKVVSKPLPTQEEQDRRYTRQLVESLGGMAESMGYGPTESTHGAMMPVDQEAYYQVEAHMRQEDSAGRAYGQRIHFRNVKAQIVLIPNTVFPTRTHLALQITYTTYDDSGNHQAHVLTLSENQVRTSELMACIAMMFQRPR